MLRCDKSKAFVPTRGKVLRSELTLEDQLAEAGWLLSLLALTKDQLDLLADNIAFLYLTGPPGTGEAGYILSNLLYCDRFTLEFGPKAHNPGASNSLKPPREHKKPRYKSKNPCVNLLLFQRPPAG